MKTTPIKIIKQTRKGTEYYKCVKCGTVGNWLEFITSGLCCKQTKRIYKRMIK